MPIYLAALGPKNVALAAEIADGWLPIFFSPYRFRELHGPSLENAPEDFQIAPLCPVLVDDDVQACRDLMKPTLALYLGGMGARGTNFYNSLAQRYGYEEAAAKIQDLYLSGMKGEAAMAVPDELVDEIALVGPKERIAERLEAWREAGDLVAPDPDAPEGSPAGDGGAAPVKEAFAAALDAPVERAVLLAGGASKEAWAVDSGGRELLIRRAAGGVIHQATLTLEQEFEVLRAAHEAGVKVPEPIAYLGEIDGREAFVMERIHGETIGRRIVKSPPPELDIQMAEELAKIHAIPTGRLPFLETGDQVARFYEELDSVGEPHPAIELGLHWVKERLPTHREPVVVHGDWRIGNIAVDEHGIVGVLDWEFSHLADPVEDLAWPLVRAWRFGADEKHLGGIGDLDRYLDRYAELTGLEVSREELLTWEVFGNVKWATGCLTQSRRHFNGLERSVELAVLGRLAAEMEYELLDLIEHAA